MMEQLVANAAEQRLRAGPLGPHLDGFAQQLREQGYASWGVRDRVRVVARLGRWLERNGRTVDELSEARIERFLRRNGRRGSGRRGDVATLRQLLSFLRARGVVRSSEAVVVRTERDVIEDAFVHYLSQERALQASTQQSYLRWVRRFLDARFGRCRTDWGRIEVQDVTDFVRRYAETTASRLYAKLMVTALRSFFRFLHVQGHVTNNLAAAVPTVASWRLSDIPRSLESDQVERLLRGCDRSTAVGRRNRALLLLLARLGLRAGEVVRLTLEDINWEVGVLIIRGKGAREDQLPLPRDVGQALAAYLRQARPSCPTRRVFVRLRAPLRGFASSVAISTIVRRALERAGIESRAGARTCCGTRWPRGCSLTTPHSLRSARSCAIARPTPRRSTRRSIWLRCALWPWRGQEVCDDLAGQGR